MLSHEPLEELAPDAWMVKGEVKRVPIGRRMIVVRDPSRGLFVHNAIELDDAGFRALDELGKMGAIFVPNRYHDIDGGRYKERYPEAVLCALPDAQTKLK